MTGRDIKEEINGIWPQSKREGWWEPIKKNKENTKVLFIITLFLWDRGILCDKTHSGHNKWESLKGII